MARRSFHVIDVTEILIHWYAGRSQYELADSLGVTLLGASARYIPTRLRTWETQQLPVARRALHRARAAGRSLQDGTWRVGEPPPFGLLVPGDSVLPVTQ